MPEFLYIHIPFCVRKCLYCDFFSVPYDESLAKAYIDALCKELTLKKDYAKSLKSIYIGGGTPSLLPDECFIQLFRCFRDNFHLSSSPEITVEANPGTVNESTITTLLSLSVNRLSIGIQSFHNDELRTLGRIHTSDNALQTVELIRRAGMSNFSIDLIYGIPGQTMDSWHQSISETIRLSPAHISTYELTPEEKTPLYELIESHRIKMPDEELILEMYNHVIDYLTFCGYEHYEVSNFALPGFRCIHNLNYWERGEYIGVGAGAHSFVKGVRSNNIKDVNNYIDDLNKGIIPEIESTKLTPLDTVKEFIFLGSRKAEGISILKLKELGLNVLETCSELVDDGYLEIENGNLRLTKKGLVISNTVIVKLFERLS